MSPAHEWDTTVKCLPPDQLLAPTLALARPLVFTNGVFDLLHAGHVGYLEAARRQGGALVVALNTDASARRLGKGAGRPINRLAERMRLVAALGCVSWVTWFDEDTPAALLQRLRPEVYVKGGDYTRETLPELPLVEHWGGRVALMPYLSGHSSSALIARIGALAP